MYHYFGTITDSKGNARADWQVEVVANSDGSTVQTLFSDQSSTPIVAVSGIANRAKTDEWGNFNFFVADGTFNLKYYDQNGVYRYGETYIPMYTLNVDTDGTLAANSDSITSSQKAIKTYVDRHFAAVLSRTAGTVVPIGDSITQATTGLSGTTLIYGPGPIEMGIRLAGKRFTQLSNKGIAGQTSTQIAARFATDVVALAPDIVTILAGTNDYTSGMANASYTTLMNNVQAMVKAALNAGILPIVVVPPVKNSAAVESRRAVRFFYRLANAWNVPLFDMFAITCDANTGNWISGYSTDGTHPNPTGNAVIGAAFGQFLASLGTYERSPYLATYSQTGLNDVANLIRNGSFAQQSAPPAPDGWTINPTNATSNASTNATAPYTGKEFLYNKTASGGAYALGGGTPTLVPGNLMEFSASIDVTGLTPASATGFNIGMDTMNGSNARGMAAWTQNGAYFVSFQFVVPAGATSGVPNVFVNDAATYKVRNMTLTDLTASDAIWAPTL